MRASSLVLFLLLLLPILASAEFVASGEIKGNVCKGFILESCKMVPIYAVQGDDDQLYEIARRYPKVDDFRESDGRCWIRTKAKGLGLLSFAANAFVDLHFFTKNDRGEYQEVDVEYLTFKCIEVP